LLEVLVQLVKVALLQTFQCEWYVGMGLELEIFEKRVESGLVARR
jgi:uncharacterized protein YodC (DUF2158 family)